MRKMYLYSLLLLSFFTVPAFAYQLIDLGADVTPTDINSNGTIVGYRIGGDGTTRIAIRIPSGGSMEDLNGGTMAYGVNENGLITGNTLTGAFLYDGVLKDIGDGHTASDISSFGVIAGTEEGTNPYRTRPLPVNPAIYDPNSSGKKWKVLDIAKVYPRGTRQGVYADIYSTLGINDAGYVVGRKSRYGIYGSAAFLIEPDFSQVTFLSIPSGGTAVAINNINKVVGASGENKAYLYDYNTSTYKELGTLGGLRSSAADINNSDQVVGTAQNADNVYSAFLWDEANGCNEVNGCMVNLNGISGASNWLLTSATAINDLGDIVGTGTVDGQVHGFLLAKGDVTPPPSPTNNQAPVAVAEADRTSGRAPLEVNFDGSRSTDSDGIIESYHWDFGDGSVASVNSVSHIYTEAGTYLATLTVTDDQGLTDMAEIEIKVRRSRSRK